MYSSKAAIKCESLFFILWQFFVPVLQKGTSADRKIIFIKVDQPLILHFI